MARLLLLVSSLFFLPSCQNPICQDSRLPQESTCTPQTQPTTPPVETPSLPGDDVPDEALHFDANISFHGFEAADEDKTNRAIEIIKKVVRSSEFKNRVINFTYQNEKKFVDNLGLTNPQIYQKILEGQETLKPEVDHEMDLDLELYYASGRTVGYTYPNVLKIWMNRKFFDAYTPSEVAGNIFHEWTHKLGFDHAFRYSEKRDYSVPYGIGYIVEELGKKYE